MAKPQRILITVIVVSVVVLLGAVAAIVVPILTHQSGGASGQVAPDGFVTEVSARGEDGRTRMLRVESADGSEVQMDQLSVGQLLTVSGQGFDASIGIYVAFCKVPDAPDEKPGPCLGGIPDEASADAETGGADTREATENAWVTNNWAWQAFATAGYDDPEAGTFSVNLVVPDPVSELLDCSEELCGVFTRADHTASGDRVQDLYLPLEITR